MKVSTWKLEQRNVTMKWYFGDIYDKAEKG